MFQIIFQHTEFMAPVLSFLFLSIICQISMGVLYHKLILETENMSSTKNKSLQQLKLKFSSCCKLHDGMSNIPVFVDKYMNKIKIYGISLSTLKHLSGQLVLLSILISGIAACKGIVTGESVSYIVPYYIVSFLGLYCYFAISSFIDITDKAKALRTNLIDYLENHLSNRLEQTSLDLKLIQGDTKEDVAKESPAAASGDNQAVSPDNAHSNTPSDIQSTIQSDKQSNVHSALPGDAYNEANYNKGNNDTINNLSDNIIEHPALSHAEAQELESLIKELLV